MSHKDVEEKAREAYRWARFASLGIELGVSVVIGTVGGWWIDIQLDCRPWALLAGVVLGFTAGIRSIMRTMRIFAAEEKQENQGADND